MYLRYLTLAIVVVVALSILQGRTSAAESFSFHSQSSFVDESKILHVLGEIENESGTPMKDILIKASFYDKAGKLIDAFEREPALQVINAGESSPFEILYTDQKTVGSVANFTLSAEGNATEAKEKQLKILSANSRLDLFGTYFVNALARNDGQENATNAILVATLYDKDGRVIAVGKALAEASPGSSDMLPGAEAPFSVPITEKLQTYKTAKYSLVAESDQYGSDSVIVQATGSGLSTSGANNQTKSGCLIATAAFGSELAPQVQELRSFRDGIALQTLAGSSFMNVFNGWYYSFSPQVADYERGQPWLQNVIRASIYPLLGILDVSTSVYGLLAFDSELAIMGAGVTASTLIGLVYFAPAAVAFGIMNRKKRWNMAKAGFILACTLSASIAAIMVAEFGAMPEVMMFGTVLLVLSAISTVIVAVARMIRS
jgi:peptide/nickel transport system substrate-binding protein